MPARLPTIALVFSLGAGLSYVAAQEIDRQPGPASAADREELPLATTPGEQLSQGEAISATGASILDRVEAMLAEARRERDVLRITCLDDKLMQIRAHLASVDERRGELTRAVESGDTQAQAHQYTTLRVLAQKLRENERDAAQCLGQGVFEVPEATASGDGPMEVVDPTVLPAMPAPEVPFIPPPASGTF